MRDRLLKEAIADAKDLRETAMANARLSLEEALKPSLSSMLSARLREEVGTGGDNVMGKGMNTSGIGGSQVTVKDPGPTEPSSAASDSSHIKNEPQEIEPMGEGVEEFADDEFAKNPQLGTPAGAPFGGDAGETGEVDVHPDGMGGEEGQFDFNGGENGAEGGELDLDAIIRELELDVNGAEGDGMATESPDMGGPAAVSPTGGPSAFSPTAAPTGENPHKEHPDMEESFSDPMAGAKVRGPMDGGVPDDRGLREDAEGCLKDGKSPKAVDGVNGGKEVKPGTAVTGTAAETMTEGDEFDLDEILREMEAEDKAPVVESEKIATENVELKRSLREHREVIQFMRGKLQEMNMLNAKLLFTNKLFKGFDMNSKQKMRVVETFDRATTVREVKLIYTTLAESFNGKTGGRSKNVASLTEGMSSRSTGSTKPKTQVLAEGNDLVARMQKLAGITR